MTSIRNVIGHQGSWQEVRKEHGAKRYVAKYASKPYQKVVPRWFTDIGRFWGASRDISQKREKPKIIPISEDELREVLREQKRGKVADWEVLPRYLWGISDPNL